MTVRRARSWNGTHYQLSQCSPEELTHILRVAHTRRQLNTFIAQVHTEMFRSSRKPSDDVG